MKDTFSKQLGNIPSCTSERWAELVAARDRDGLIRQSWQYVTKYNSRTPDFIREDCAMYALQRAIVAIDLCLADGRDSDKLSAYLRRTVINSLSEARRGKAGAFVSTNVYPTQPHTRTNKELETKLRQSGLSESMVEAELFSQGYQLCARLKVVESQWPKQTNDDGKTKASDFAGNVGSKRRHSGTKRGMQSLESLPTSPDDWEFLETHLTTDQFDYLKLKAEGWTNEELASEYSVTVQEQAKIMAAIKATIHRHQEDND